MNLNELDQYLELINSVLLKSAVKINKWREKFMLEVLLLYLILPGRINFLQLGRFWSGCAKMAKRGLEISGIGLIDMDLHTCFQMEAGQTPPAKTLEQVKYTLIDWYLHVLRTRKETLERLTN